MELAPIVIFSYNRPDHLKRTLDALSKNDLASDSILFIFCDGPKALASSDNEGIAGIQNSARRLFKGTQEEYQAYLQKIRGTVELARSQSWPKELHVIEREKNIGLAASIVGAVTDVVNRYGRVITLEDDVVTSSGFLRYMNDALETYKDDDKVMHISAYMYPHKGHLPETFFFPVPYPGGGWATWSRAWKFYNDDTTAVYDQWKDRWKTFDVLGGDYLSKQLIANYNGTMRTWFVKWHAALLSRDALTLYPHQSLTNNIGFDNQATNCLTTNKFDVDVLAETVSVERAPLKVNNKASRIIYAFYQGRWYNKRRRKALAHKIIRALAFWK